MTGLVCLTLLSACTGSGSTSGDDPDPTPAPAPTSGPSAEPTGTDDAGTTLGPGEVLSAHDDGAVVLLAPGEETLLQLAPPWQDAVVEVADPDVVELVPVEFFDDPGFAEYTVLAHVPGRTTLTVDRADGELVSINVVVE